MTITALIIAIAAILYVRTVSSRCNDLEDRLGEVRRSMMGREAEIEELQTTVTFLHKIAERLAKGVEIDPLMVREKRLFASATVADLVSAFDGGEPPYVIDVRSADEWAGGHIRGSVNMPVDSLETSLHGVRRDGCKIYVICAMGSRSESASGMLAERGYIGVYNVQGGMSGWRGEVVKD
ncbi:MAG: phage shock protein E [Pseudohongiellaceae bacterium]|jgi:phage shock protein E